MFSLIISIISIALVVVLIAATMYNGGDTLTEGKAIADASRLKAQEQQILASTDLFYADTGSYPNSMQDLVSAGYLTAVPPGLNASAALTVVSPAIAQSVPGWQMAGPGTPVFQTAANVPRLTCSKFNLASRGDDGILTNPHEDIRSQCYGSEGSYRVVAYKAGFSLTAVLGEDVRGGGVPNIGSDDWAHAPTTGGSDAPTEPEPPEEPSEPPFTHAVQTSGDLNLAAWNGDASPVGVVTFRNDGNAPMTLYAPIFGAAPLQVTRNECEGIPAGASCNMEIALLTTQRRSGNGRELFEPYGTDDLWSGFITWRVSATVARWGTFAQHFANAQIGVPNEIQIGLQNIGNEVADLSGQLTGDLHPDYTVDNSHCGSIAPNMTCMVSVRYVPSAVGSTTSTITNIGSVMFTDNQLVLSGQVRPPLYGESHFAASGGTQVIPPGIALTYVRVTNNTGTTLSIGDVTIDGVRYANYSNDSWAPGAVKQYEVNKNSTITVRIGLTNNGQNLNVTSTGSVYFN